MLARIEDTVALPNGRLGSLLPRGTVRCGAAQAEGLRYALVAICFSLVWAAYHYWRAGLHIGARHREKLG